MSGLEDPGVALVLAVVFGAAGVRGAFGFGDAVVAMPLLATLLGLRTATPLVAMLAVTVGAVMLGMSWRAVDVRGARRLILATAFGVPGGLFLLKGLPEGPMKLGLGALLLAFAVYGCVRPTVPPLRDDHWAYPVGLLAGVLGGAYNTNGPPVVVYGTLRGWSPEAFRATLQGYFVATGVLVLAGHAAAGLWTGQVVRLYAVCLPALGAGLATGTLLARRWEAERFRRYVYVLLGGLALLLLRDALGQVLAAG